MQDDQHLPPNPLFGQNNSSANPKPSASKKTDGSNEALDIIRQKIDNLYASEPNAKEELSISENAKHLSKHQQYMHNLSQSGKSLAEIQVAWHQYYQDLPDHEKHEVWSEFQQQHNQHGTNKNHKQAAQPGDTKHHEPAKHHHGMPHPQPSSGQQYGLPDVSPNEVQHRILSKVSTQAKRSRKKDHLKSLGFGLSMGLISLAILMFGFFNERFIAPFITPSRSVSSTPIIADSTTGVSKDPKIIIPKINVEIPVIYGEQSIDEAAVQRALEGGVLHYPTTSKPGEKGNVVIFGHSSNNILNKGKYKFAFVLLNKMEPGDTFMLEKDSVRYIYKVFDKKVVTPTDLSVLDSHDKPTATLITCDPPGTSTNRLVVTAEQISPSPDNNIASTAKTANKEPAILPSNAPSLWDRFWSWIST